MDDLPPPATVVRLDEPAAGLLVIADPDPDPDPDAARAARAAVAAGAVDPRRRAGASQRHACRMTGRLRLIVSGAGSTDLLLRVVNLIAQRGFDPWSVEARRDSETMRIVIVIDAATDGAVEAMAERLRSLVQVERVSLEVSDQADILT